jgi:hypothetical protein
MTEAELTQIERRALASGPSTGLRGTRDSGPAGPATAAFITHAHEDVLKLVAAIRASEHIADDELDAVAARAAAAGPPPWPVFLESDGGMAGSSLIWVGGTDDAEEDLYLWRGEAFAPDEDFVFIAHAREDIPRLVETARAL